MNWSILFQGLTCLGVWVIFFALIGINWVLRNIHDHLIDSNRLESIKAARTGRRKP